jgi:hypothetical protein
MHFSAFLVHKNESEHEIIIPWEKNCGFAWRKQEMIIRLTKFGEHQNEFNKWRKFQRNQGVDHLNLLHKSQQQITWQHSVLLNTD